MRTALYVLLPALGGCGLLGGRFDGPPSEMEANISAEAKALIAAAFDGIDRDALVDAHVHLAQRDGFFMEGPAADVIMSGAGAEDDEGYLARLVDLLRHTGGRAMLYALDHHHDRAKTSLYVPNDAVLDAARRWPELFIPVGSVHPYRDDALDELDRLAAAGVRHIKWLPNAMGMDPADARCDAFYARLVAHRMVLMSHTGRERSLEAEGGQHLGNPLRLRRALDAGVTVVALHCASDGYERAEGASNFDLFLRMMETYDQLYGDLSAVTFHGHLPEPLRVLLERSDLHARLINGSDYPIPGVSVVVRPSTLLRYGFITRDQWDPLNEIYAYNPMLFDFVVKRTVRHPRTGARFPASIFTLPAALRGD